MTHTPGPWVVIPAVEYDGDEDEFQGAYTSPAMIEGDDGSPVCAFGSAEGSGTLFENKADYSLIAAAPDLLSAMRFVLAFYEPGQTHLDANAWKQAEASARRAVAKAEGKA